MSESHSSTVFTLHKLSLHALLLEGQPWFCARDIGRLMGVHLSDRMVSKLDKDQHRFLWIEYHRQPDKQLMLSESAVYALLVYHYVPGNRLLREWLTHQVVPALRDAASSENPDLPMLSFLKWPEMSVSLLHWQDAGFGYEICRTCCRIRHSSERLPRSLGGGRLQRYFSRSI